MAVAVKVTGSLLQAAGVDEFMVTEAGKAELTLIVIAFDVAGFPVAQDMFEFSIQVTTSLFAGVYVKIMFPAPAFTPLTFH